MYLGLVLPIGNGMDLLGVNPGLGIATPEGQRMLDARMTWPLNVGEVYIKG